MKLERENKVIETMNNSERFQFELEQWKLRCNPTKLFLACSRICPCFVKKLSLNASMHLVKNQAISTRDPNLRVFLVVKVCGRNCNNGSEKKTTI